MLLLLRQLPLRYTTRFYAKNATAKNSMKQVHQETLRLVDQFARINISSDIFLKVHAADINKYPNGDTFIAELHGGQVKNCTATMDVQVSDDGMKVDVQVKKLLESSDFQCELAVPVRSSVYIDANDTVDVAHMYGDNLCVSTEKDITSQDIRVGNLTYRSNGEHITCSGLLLADQLEIETNGQGNATLDYVQGNKLMCKTDAGNISCNSCFVSNTLFETESGCLDLKNVHKKVEFRVKKPDFKTKSGEPGHFNANFSSGSLHFSLNKGVLDLNLNGAAQMCFKGGRMNLQLAQLIGTSNIQIEDNEEANISFADYVEENCHINIESKPNPITLDDTLLHLSEQLSDDKNIFCSPKDEKTALYIEAKNSYVKLGKMSFVDAMRATLGISEK